MKTADLNRLIEAVLYEGHILYPYRPSSRKNRQRFIFGRVYPEAYSVAQHGTEGWIMQTQCLVRPRPGDASIDVSVRFLQPLVRDIGVLPAPSPTWPLNREVSMENVPVFEVDGALYQAWHEAVERSLRATVHLSARTAPQEQFFSFAATRELEPIRDRNRQIVAVISRHHPTIAGLLEVSAEPIDRDLWRLTVRISNRSTLTNDEARDADAVLLRTFASTHTILRGFGASFVSLTDPPVACAHAAAACRNVGVWPVLVGEQMANECDLMLASPIMLPDNPKITTESADSLFDRTEIDEILSLRILTMTDEEKREMRDVDEQARQILERTEAVDGAEFLRNDGKLRAAPSTMEELFSSSEPLAGVEIGGVVVRSGDRVRVHPRAHADTMDIALAGKVAIVEAVEQDADGKVYLAVVFEDDPGRDLGLLRQPGHRFVYGIDEVEPLRKQMES